MRHEGAEELEKEACLCGEFDIQGEKYNLHSL
jgi:hypothetical protein